jgi:uncharacterized membrane protein
MSVNKTDDAVSEYLREVGARLSGLPLLQRRELLADLEAHIAGERAERNVQSEGEVLEILERLGSPEALAAAAYAEAGLPLAPPARAVPDPPVPPARSNRSWWLLWAAAGLIVLLLLLGAVAFLARSGTEIGPSDPRPAVRAPR